MKLKFEDFKDDLKSFLADKTEVGIITNKTNALLIPKIVELIDSQFKTIILTPVDIACKIKTKKMQSYILLCLECPFHSLDNCFSPRKLNIDGNVLNDELLKNCSLKNVNENYFDNFENLVIKTKDQNLYEKIAKLSHNTVINSYEHIPEVDKVRFLSSRMNRVEKIKNRKTFGIFFTSEIYIPLVEKIEKFLESIGKDTLVVFIRDISMERLIAIEFVDVVVIVDCPLFARFGDDIFIPVVNPFEISICFGKWDGSYKINEFEPVFTEESTYFKPNECLDIILAGNTRDLEFENLNTNDLKIYKGDSGGPTNYKKID